MKKVISLLLTLLICSSFTVTASAKTVPGNVAQPFFEKVTTAKSELSISGAKATCKSKLKYTRHFPALV